MIFYCQEKIRFAKRELDRIFLFQEGIRFAHFTIQRFIQFLSDPQVMMNLNNLFEITVRNVAVNFAKYEKCQSPFLELI